MDPVTLILIAVATFAQQRLSAGASTVLTDASP
jgi:hypothetical protein